ncbi:MAG: hypothetical protein AAFU78_18885 [Cyanobacteria bacterium J06633_2]
MVDPLNRRMHRDNLGGCAAVVYDFAQHGGVVGDIALDLKLPAGTIIKFNTIKVNDAFTSGGLATVAVKAEGAADLLAATAIASLTAGALVDGVADYTAANMVELTEERAITVTVATAALTGGSMVIYLDYYDRFNYSIS